MIFKAGSTIPRASSGSSRSINSVEPLRSAKSAVTVLRSPSATADGVADAVCSTGLGISCGLEDDAGKGGAAVLADSEPPQSPQNFFPAGLSLPHFEQRIFP